MAARLHRALATVELADGTRLEHVSVSVRQNIATIRLGTEVLVEREVVAAVAPQGRRSWRLTFEGAEAGDSWLVSDERRKCCGRK